MGFYFYTYLLLCFVLNTHTHIYVNFGVYVCRIEFPLFVIQLCNRRRRCCPSHVFLYVRENINVLVYASFWNFFIFFFVIKNIIYFRIIIKHGMTYNCVLLFTQKIRTNFKIQWLHLKVFRFCTTSSSPWHLILILNVVSFRSCVFLFLVICKIKNNERNLL